jgi:hypothetical protein
LSVPTASGSAHVNEPGHAAPHDLVVDGSSDKARSLREQLPFSDMLLIQIQEVLREDDVKENWRRLLLQYGNAEQLSPYRINITAGGKMFFGRRAELSKLSRSHGCALIYGPRRIGKTSVALRLSSYIREDKRYQLKLGDFPIFRSSYVDVGKLGEDASRNIWSHLTSAWLRHKEISVVFEAESIFPSKGIRCFRG